MKYYLIAGEASGDLHASNLMKELKAIDNQAEFRFFGGDLMLAQGGTLVKHYREMAYMGFIPVLMNLRTILSNMSFCKKDIEAYKPDVVILIDYPSFNLKIARFVKENLGAKVYYYISPKIWAWKEYRIKAIKKYIDKMYSILPFEIDFYKKHNYEINYVGNPSVDSVDARPNKNQTFEQFIAKNNLPNKPIVALLAGSRKQEINKCLPVFMEIVDRFPNYQFIVGGAPSIEPSLYQSIIQDKNIKVVYNQTYDLLQQAHAAVVNSGTASLETAILNIPQVVAYHIGGGRIALYLIRGRLIKVKWASLVNLIANREVVKELIGYELTPESLTEELTKLVSDEKYRNRIFADYDEVNQKLGQPGASKKAAELIYKSLKK